VSGGRECWKFYFNARRTTKEKTVLGRRFPAVAEKMDHGADISPAIRQQRNSLRQS
jgi:hypothetical protein